eukprot:evm.model.scf_627.4 EVM.evm.TU.scf_627.4   scf_627:46227-55552(+)
MELDLSKQNKQEALYDMLLGICVILELCIFVAVLHRNTTRILVAPLERIFNTIQKNASQIMSALETENEDADATEISTIEAAINKMSKLVAHVTASGTQGQHVVKDYLQDVHTTDDTKAWLHEMAGGSAHGNATEPNRGRKSTVGAGWLDKVTQKHMEKAMSLSGDRQKAPKLLVDMADVDLDRLNSWDFDVYDYTTEELMTSICVMFEQLELAEFKEEASKRDDESKPLVTMDILYQFIDKVRERYNDVPYHNFFHCVDVTHATYRFIMLTIHKTHMTRVERFALVVAALCHDLDHPGLNNAFLVNSRSELARLYNDNSVLENRHVSCLYTLVAEHPEADVFQLLDEATWKEVRKIAIGAILHTDMQHHFAMVSKVDVFYELHASAINVYGRADSVEGDYEVFQSGLFKTTEDRLFMISMLLHCADISNAVKPLKISERWATNVLNEFFAQGDLEQERGLPISPMCNRDTTSRPQSQINFIEFIVAPLYFQVVRIFPELRLSMINLRDNRRYWDEQHLKSINESTEMSSSEREEEKKKAQQRFSAFVQKYKEAFDDQRWSAVRSSVRSGILGQRTPNSTPPKPPEPG